jgi:hypothetical protein
MRETDDNFYDSDGENAYFSLLDSLLYVAVDHALETGFNSNG